MTKENEKKTKRKFKNLSEMNNYIITEKFGPEIAERVRKGCEKLKKMHLEPPTKYIN
jgi:hypothetical protein